MKKLFCIVSILASLLFSMQLFAHGTHSHDKTTVSMMEAEGLASKEIDRLIKEGKVDNVFAGKPVNASMSRVNNQRQWVVTTKADTADGEQELQVFLSTEGYFLSFGVVEH
ncbi:hypothetical protein JF535_12035 [Microbulbifer salipaludis]|uniref:Uncharacterized protein n=1 Tax=Microbulbifer salipaludis TaxID=187980 RepID=A0ABS3E8D5_9GAMM|nr:DUF6488 family protein [Microbulbifer salipaludis]MBN8431583.1 hypothetical protein [Microbulbifer salipaludis]